MKRCCPLSSVFIPEKQRVYLVEFVNVSDNCEQHVYDVTQSDKRLLVNTGNKTIGSRWLFQGEGGNVGCFTRIMWRLIMRGNNVVGMVCAFVSLFSVLVGVSAFFGILASMVVSLAFQTESELVFFWVGAPVSIVLTFYWMVKWWRSIRNFVTDR